MVGARAVRAALAATIVLGSASFGVETAPAGWSLPGVIGHLPDGVKESSGLAVSRRQAGVYWTHNDSGGKPVLQAFREDCTACGAVRLKGVKNVDWEDMASFMLDGRAWLLVADVGDNASERRDCALHVIEEPAPADLRAAAARGKPLVAKAAWTIPVTYPDGPRDCEAVAVDAGEGRVYLLAKRVKPHGLYVLPLRPVEKGGRQSAPVAERVGEIASFPEAEGAAGLLPMPTGKYRAQPTGMDFAADGSAAVIVTYGDVLLYSKTKDETWAAALAGRGLQLAPHGLPQAEAVCFGLAGGESATDILVTSEGEGAAVLRYRRR